METLTENLIGEIFKQVRIARGFTQAELAAKAEVSPATISKTENNRAPKRNSVRRRIAKALGVSITTAFAAAEPDTNNKTKKQGEQK